MQLESTFPIVSQHQRFERFDAADGRAFRRYE